MTIVNERQVNNWFLESPFHPHSQLQIESLTRTIKEQQIKAARVEHNIKNARVSPHLHSGFQPRADSFRRRTIGNQPSKNSLAVSERSSLQPSIVSLTSKLSTLIRVRFLFSFSDLTFFFPLSTIPYSSCRYWLCR